MITVIGFAWACAMFLLFAGAVTNIEDCFDY